MARKPRKKPSKRKLQLRKKPLADLPVTKKPADKVKGGFAPPYTPIGPVVKD